VGDKYYTISVMLNRSREPGVVTNPWLIVGMVKTKETGYSKPFPGH